MLTIRRPRGIVLALTLFAVTACGGPQARFTAHMSRGQSFYAAGNFAKANIEFRNALQIAPKNAGARVMAGRTAEKLGRFPEAAGLYQAVLDDAPNSDSPDTLQARTNLGRLLILGGAAQRGLKIVEPALAKHPNDAELLTLRATARLQVNHDDTAAAVLDVERALQLAPTNQDAIALRARLYENAGDSQRAVALLSDAVRRLPNSVDVRELAASVFSEAGAPGKTEEQLRALVTMRPEELRYRTELARFYVRDHRLDDAQHVLEGAVQALPGSDAAKMILVDFLASERTPADAERTLRAFVTAAPGNLDLRLGLGDLLERRGAWPEAADVYKEMVRQAGNGPEGLTARDRLAGIAVRQGREDEARKLIAEVLGQSPRDNGALELRAALALSHGDPTAAIADLRAVLRDQPRAVNLQMLLARAYLANDDPTMAEQALRAAMDLQPADPKIRIQLAQLLVTTNRAEQAVALLEPAVRAAPTDAATREELIRAYLAKRDLAAARTAAEDLKTLRPNDASGPYLAGLVAQTDGRFEDAQRDYQQALALQPTALDVVSALARLQFAHGRQAEAIALVKKAAAADPKNALPLNLLGELYLAQHDIPLASSTLSEATALAPTWSTGWRNLALAKVAAKDVPGAIAAYQTAIKSSPAEVRLIMELGLLCEQQGRIDDAIGYYEKWHDRNPRVQVAANNLAMLLVTYRTDQASLDRARSLTAGFAASQDARLLDTYGWVRFKRAEYADAMPALQRAVAQAPNSQELRYHLGMVELRLGQTAQARSDLQAAVAGSGTYRWSADARSALADIKGRAG
jgi:Flp pilus assembly protein TadD